jgi:hypothetical protein
MSLPLIKNFIPSDAKAFLSHHLMSDRGQTTIAALGTKSVGSYYRIQDDKDAPPPIQKATKKREALLLTLTLIMTPIAETFFGKFAIPQLHKVIDTAPYKKLLMLPPIMLGLAAAEMLSRVIYPKAPRIYADETGTVQGKKKKNLPTCSCEDATLPTALIFAASSPKIARSSVSPFAQQNPLSNSYRQKTLAQSSN